MDKHFEYREDDFDAMPVDAFASEQIFRPHTTYVKDVWRSFRKRKTALFAFVLLSVMIFLVLFGPMMNPHTYFTNNLNAVNQPPSAEHWFGTDILGRDLWTRVWVGGRVSLLIALLATIFPFTIGMAIGGISGYFGGKVDDILMRIVEVLQGIPALIYMILLMMVFGSGSIATLVIAFTITGWLGAARSTRGLVLMLKARDFVMASETLGASPWRIIAKHLIPNTMGISVIGMTMMVPGIIFAEAFLSFIGLGVTPPSPSWGQLIATASDHIRLHPYQFIIPCVCISISLLCFNLVGDGLRDALDPRLRT